MKPRPKAVYHLGTCHQCNGEGDVLTIPGNPLDLSLCGSCLALLIADAAGIRSAIRERWTMMNQRAAALFITGASTGRAAGPEPSIVLR